MAFACYWLCGGSFVITLVNELTRLPIIVKHFGKYVCHQHEEIQIYEFVVLFCVAILATTSIGFVVDCDNHELHMYIAIAIHICQWELLFHYC